MLGIPIFFPFLELSNEGKDCRQHCDVGDCDWCGTEGKCCRKNWIGGSCNGFEGARYSRACVRKGKCFCFKFAFIKSHLYFR